MERGALLGLEVLKYSTKSNCIFYVLNRAFINTSASKPEVFKSLKLGGFQQLMLMNQVQLARHLSYEESAKLHQQRILKQPLIYYGKLGSKVKGLKVVSLSSSLLAILSQPLIFDQLTTLSLPAFLISYAMIGFFTFVTPIFIHSFTKKYVLEIKYDPHKDIYLSKTLNFFMSERLHKFKLDDIQVIEGPSLFSTFLIKKKPFIVFTDGFLDNQHYIKMMRYDKPIDLRMDTSSEKDALEKGEEVKSIK